MEQSLYQQKVSPNQLIWDLGQYAIDLLNKGHLLSQIEALLKEKLSELAEKHPRVKTENISIHYRYAALANSNQNTIYVSVKNDTQFAIYETPHNPRPALQWFTDKMEQKLIDNDNKPGWKDMYLAGLHQLLHDQCNWLEGYLDDEEDSEKIITKCINIANYAMMIADKHGFNIGDINE